MPRKTNLLNSIVPGEIRAEEFMKPLGLSINHFYLILKQGVKGVTH